MNLPVSPDQKIVGDTLLIISHTPHFHHEGRYWGWAPTIRELDWLSSLFQKVIHVAPLYPGVPPKSALPYASANITLASVTPSGGNSLDEKWRILKNYPAYFNVISRYLKIVDAVHVRCPANISMLALLMLLFQKFPQKRWFKYAGTWMPQQKEPWSYSFQRWLLRTGLLRGIVTVNGSWLHQPAFIRSFYNPSFSASEWLEAQRVSSEKRLIPPIQVLFVGRLEEAKGVDRALDIVQIFEKNRVPYTLHLVGDGDKRKWYEERCGQAMNEKKVIFWGWLSPKELYSLYAKAHFVLLPSSSEGWPKVLSEGMAFGAIPISSSVSCIPQYLQSFQVGAAIPVDKIQTYQQTLLEYLQMPEKWEQESARAREHARKFTYEYYLEKVRELFVEQDII